MAGLSRTQRELLWEMADGFEIWDTFEGAYLMNRDGQHIRKIKGTTLRNLREQECVDLVDRGVAVNKYQINELGLGCARQQGR